MANKRHKPEEIVQKLRQVDVLVGQAMQRRTKAQTPTSTLTSSQSAPRAAPHVPQKLNERCNTECNSPKVWVVFQRLRLL